MCLKPKPTYKSPLAAYRRTLVRRLLAEDSTSTPNADIRESYLRSALCCRGKCSGELRCVPPFFFPSEFVYAVRAVAYVKYERASSAAAAMESLHEAILENGRTKLKVLLAEEPHATCASAAALAYVSIRGPCV